jgi:septum formation protein
MPSDLEETLVPGPLAEAVARLALDKAQAVAARLREGIVLGADTVVTIDGDALGKPADPAHARAMLRRLRAREHEVITGVAVVDAGSGRAERTAVTSRVRMAAYADADIDAYVATGEPLDKAGAYAIQGLGAPLIERVEGDFFGVMGLPLRLALDLLAKFGRPYRFTR